MAEFTFYVLLFVGSGFVAGLIVGALIGAWLW